jgi:uncharacterized lipoprotein YehR (DUF1307 family)
MKNTFKLFGIIVFVTIMVFSMAGCTNYNVAELIVVNENANAITGIRINNSTEEWLNKKNLNIKSNKSKSFDVWIGASEIAQYVWLTVDKKGEIRTDGYVWFDGGTTTTITLTADGKIDWVRK